MCIRDRVMCEGKTTPGNVNNGSYFFNLEKFNQFVISSHLPLTHHRIWSCLAVDLIPVLCSCFTCNKIHLKKECLYSTCIVKTISFMRNIGETCSHMFDFTE